MAGLIMDFSRTNKILVVATLCIHKLDQQSLKQLRKLQDHEMSPGFKAKFHEIIHSFKNGNKLKTAFRMNIEKSSLQQSTIEGVSYHQSLPQGFSSKTQI